VGLGAIFFRRSYKEIKELKDFMKKEDADGTEDTDV